MFNNHQHQCFSQMTETYGNMRPSQTKLTELSNVVRTNRTSKAIEITIQLLIQLILCDSSKQVTNTERLLDITLPAYETKMNK